MSLPSVNQAVTIDDATYVPRFQLTVDDQRIDPETHADVLGLRVTLQKDDVGGFELTLSNHFTVLEDKIADSCGKDTLRTFQYSDDTRFDILKPIKIEMGYADKLRTMFVGEIMTLQPSFPSTGAPTMVVRGTDFLGRLRRDKPGKDKTKAFKDRADWQIVKEVAERHQIDFSDKSDTTGSKNVLPVFQKDMDDLQFVLHLAKLNDFVATIEIDDTTRKPTLYFGKPRDKRDGQAIKQLGLEWGTTLISFTPTLKVGRMVSKVTVRGWDSRTKAPIEYTAKVEDLAKTSGKGKSGPQWLEEKAGGKEERIVDWPVTSQAEAKARAIQILHENANEFLTASGETIGNPDIRPLTILNLKGIGKRFNGDYHVIKATHTYGASGYGTTFEVERMREETSC